MAQNEAVFAIRITDEGTLQIVQKNAGKAAASIKNLGAAVDQTAESQDHFNRAQKGVAGATSNSTKSFSKMRDAIGSSSGLVGAYATLAANIFALSAAFSALNRSFQAEQLAKSIEFLSASSGTNLARISKNLVEVTGNAISMSDAMKSASFGTSAGFNSTQLETLAKVAKGASIALGRDLNDSFDRLTRGAAKLEPEILDELGIIVRIDKAVADYAAQVGKSVKELSLWERQQAFVNAINQQGITKYGELADAIQTSPYDRILAALTNASNATLKWLNDSLKLPEFLNYLAESTTALTGAVGLFASTISRQMLPMVYKIPEAFAAVALSASNVKIESLTQTLSSLDTSSFTKPAKQALGEFSKAIKEGTLDASKMQGVIAGLDKSYSNLERRIKGQNTSINNNRVAHDALQKELLKEGADTAKLTTEIAKLDAEYAKLNATLAGTQQKLLATGAARTEAQGVGTAIKGSEAKQQLSTGIAALGAMNLFGLKDIFKGVKGGLEEINLSAAGTFGSIGKFASKAALIIGTAFSASLAAILGFLSVISLIALVFPGLEEKAKKWWKSFTGQTEEGSKALEIARKELDTFAEHISKVDGAIKIDINSTNVEGTIEAISRLAGVLNELAGTFASTYKKIIEENKKFIDDLGRTELLLQEKQSKLKIAALEKKQREEIFNPTPKAFQRGMSLSGQLDQERGKLEGIQRQLNSFNTQEIEANAREIPIFVKEALDEINKLPSTNIYASITDPKVREAAKQELTKTAEDIKKKRDETLATISSVQSPMGAGAYMTPQEQIDTVKYAYEDLVNFVTANVTKLRAGPEEFMSRIKEIPEGASKISQALGAAADKSKGKFGELVDLLDKYQGKIQGSATLSQELNRILGEKAGSELAAALQTNDVESIIKSIRAAAAAEANIPGLEKQLQVAQTITKLVPTSTQAALDVQTLSLKLTNEKIALEEASIAILKQQGDNQTAIAGKEAVIQGLRLESLETTTKTLDPLRQMVIENDKQLQVAQQLNELKLDNLKIEQRLETFSKTGRLETTYQQTKKNIAEEFKLKREALARENSLSLFNLEIEKYKLQLLLEEYKLRGGNNQLIIEGAQNAIASYNTQVEQAKALNAERVKSLDLAEREAQIQAATQNFNPVERTTTTSTILPQNGVSYDAMAMSRSVTEVAAKVATQEEEKLKAVKTAQEDILANADKAGTGLEEIFAAQEKLAQVNSRLEDIKNNKDPFTNIKIGLETARVASEAFKESLKGLGPGGEAIAIAIEGTQNMVSAWVSAFEVMKKEGSTFKEQTIAVLGAVSASLSALSATMNAASANRIAGIDAEIEAEQRRDGKSKESVARISALEKKKEAEKRKQFETNKKMMMAQTVINTAAGMMAVIGQLGWVGIAVAALIGAMGAAQLAIISGMSYQGGGASTAAGAPSSVAVGQRTSSIDLAKSKSASGELSYLQGAQGMGGPEAFTPAFTGMKYRASGGATTGFMVGEQGPELFIPDRPGTIVPADQTANMGGVTNVNFSISAIDTQGVEDMLENQKGAIINMIRSAANSYGQPFIEQVDTSVYRPAPKSRTYRR